MEKDISTKWLERSEEGYSNRANGNVTVVVGKAIKYSEDTCNVTLEIERKLSGIYNSDLTDVRSQGRTTSSVLSNRYIFE